MFYNSKIIKKIKNIIFEYKKLQHQLFHRKALLKINYQIAISTKNTKLSKKFYLKIFNILNERKISDNIGKDSVWFSISNKHHKVFLDNVRKDPAKIKIILDNPSKFNLFFGFDNNCEYLSRRPRNIDWYENDELVIDKVLNLAEFFGILRHNNPERYKRKFSKPSIDDLIEKIEKKLSIKLDFKNVFPNEEGINTKRGILSNREIQAIYQAYRIKRICEKNNYKSILEIGGGLGRTAYYCYKFGVKNYTMTDLLVPRICQLNYLSRVLNEKVILNENELNSRNSKNCIKVISPEYLFRKKKNFDLVFNSDSFTEIDLQNQKKYIGFIEKNSKSFFSINHESNIETVKNLFLKTKVKRYDRSLYWLRRGYLEEHFQIK